MNKTVHNIKKAHNGEVVIIALILSFIFRTVSIVFGIVLILSSLFCLMSVTLYRTNPKFWDKVSDNKTTTFLPDIKAMVANRSVYLCDSILFFIIGILLLSGIHITFVYNTVIECWSFL